MEDKKTTLTLKQEEFTQTWLDTKGNGTEAALVAFDIEGKEILENRPLEMKDKEYNAERSRIENVASSMATEYLRKPDIIKRIDELLEERGFTDEAVKREHFKLLTSHKDEIKVKAIDSYYKIKGKYVNKIEHSGEVVTVTPEARELANKAISDYLKETNDSPEDNTPVTE